MASHAQRIERIASLVAEPSVSSAVPELNHSNRRVIDKLADWLDAAGFAVEIMPLPNAPNKANLLATLGRGTGGLVLAGHTDTVPFDQALWQSDPFQLTERDGKLHGLGSADMKGFLALALEAADGVNPDALRAPLMILATADEETSMDGARALVQQQRPKARHAIIGEPTDLRPVRAHKGIFMEQIRLIGRTGHSSDPRLGNNALDGMTRVLQALLTLRDELAQRYHNDAFALPYPTLNLGRIHGGDSPNRICGECALDLDLRLVPGMQLDEMRTLVRQRATDAVAGLGLTFEATALFEGVPAFELARDAELLRVAEELTGEAAQTVAFGTEAPYLAALGSDTIVCGPGGIDQAHRPDEYVRADQLAPTVQLLQAMVARFCQ
ncbi:MAG: acetylornithine deacetylase [Polyangiales bacterium]